MRGVTGTVPIVPTHIPIDPTLIARMPIDPTIGRTALMPIPALGRGFGYVGGGVGGRTSFNFAVRTLSLDSQAVSIPPATA